MKISNETKARYIHMYYGQKILRSKIWYKHVPDTIVGEQTLYGDMRQWEILLRPISNLNDSELLTAGKIFDLKNPTIERDSERIIVNDRWGYKLQFWYKKEFTIYTTDEDGGYANYELGLRLFQYLQSIGIALPFYSNGETYSVSDLVEAGVIKLIE